MQHASNVALADDEKGKLQMSLIMWLPVQYTRVIYAFMGLAGFSTLFLLTGILALQLIQLAGVPVDALSLVYILYNFAVRPYRCQVTVLLSSSKSCGY